MNVIKMPDGKINIEDVAMTLLGIDADNKQIEAKAKELEAEYEALQYQRDRAAEYPSLEEQEDMRYHDAINGTTVWLDTITAIKEKYPKGDN